MKNKLREPFRDCWRVLTEVPGWPDAPGHLRLRRLLPVVLPVAAMASVLLWSLLWTQPRIRLLRTLHQPTLALEQEVSDLRLACSDDRASEVAALAAKISQALLPEPSRVAPVLEQFTKAAQVLGWEAVLHPLPMPSAAPPPDALMTYVNARGKLTPSNDNTQSFVTLLALLEQFSLPNQSIDLTRLSVRADEHGKQSVEVYLRFGCRLPHEKTAQ